VEGEVTARLVVTLPPTVIGAEAVALTRSWRQRGVEFLEVRNDLHADDAVDTAALAGVIDLLVSERGRPLAASWIRAARRVDRPLRLPLGAEDMGTSLVSHHAERLLTPDEAVSLWASRPPAAGVLIKHVEPLGDFTGVARLVETRERLVRRFGDCVTVLATGAAALPARCVLATGNALDYVAADGSWAAAPGQRLLVDALRERRARRPGLPRRAILGSHIAHSLSPRLHTQPFDRLDLPAGSAIGSLLEALHPYYRGFAVTSPFKGAAAEVVGGDLEAVNTLARTASGWVSANTDVDGARAVLQRLAPPFTVLGDGGATVALKVAADELKMHLRVLPRDALTATPLTGSLIWTWPPQIVAPEELRFERARVAVIAYGEPGRAIASAIGERGGEPVAMGLRWFFAQARAQRRFWEEHP
jgi:hypothetical protein